YYYSINQNSLYFTCRTQQLPLRKKLVPHHPLLEKVTRQEKHKEKQQAPIYKNSFLPRSECIPTKPKLLVLSKTSYFNSLTLKKALGSSTGWASPILGQLLKWQSWRYWIRWVPHCLIILVTTRPAFIYSSVQDREFLFKPALIELLLLLRRRRSR
ncbi:hypothetical protein PanWU01x14_054560, partial [Parasponia andersonii]